MPESRIQWKEHENRQVAIRWIEICQRRNEDPMAPSSLGGVAREAQVVLEPSRRRTALSLQGRAGVARILEQVANIIKERKASAKAAEALARQKQEREEAERAEADRRAAEVAAEAVAKAAAIKPTPVPELPLLGANGASLESIVQAFGQGVAVILVNEFRKELKRTFHEEFPKLQARTLAVAKVLPRILVVGPLSKQQPALEEAVQGVADLKFVSSEESAKLVKLRGQNCAAGVTWINFVDHAHTNAMKSLFGDGAIQVSGGLDKLKSVVEETALRVQIPDAIQ